MTTKEGDLKMVNFLLQQQTGYKKYPCFLCYWDSRDKANHWTGQYEINLMLGKMMLLLSNWHHVAK